MEIHRSARRHGIDDQDIRHAMEHPVVVADIDPDELDFLVRTGAVPSQRIKRIVYFGLDDADLGARDRREGEGTSPGGASR